MVFFLSKGGKDEKREEGIGLYQLLSMNGDLINIKTSQNDCGIAVF